MNVWIREMKANFKPLIAWSIGIIFMVAGGMSKYSASSKSGQSLNDLIAKMPKSIQSLFGVGSFDLSKASGFYGVIFIYIVIMAIIHASLLGANIISKEERDKTSEFLYVKPISRRRIITQKLLAALVNIVVLNLISLFSSLLIVGAFSNDEVITGDIIKLTIGLLILQIIFLFLGSGMSAISKNPKTASSKVGGLILVFYILYKLIELSKKLEFLKYLTPFKYFDAQDLMYDGTFNSIYLVLSAVSIVSMLIVTYAFYEKRDLNF